MTFIRTFVSSTALALGALLVPCSFAQAPTPAQAASANQQIRALITEPVVSTMVPGYTTTPPEAALAGERSLGRAAATRLSNCAARPDDISCQAVTTAVRSANTPRPSISPTEPSLVEARALTASPGLTVTNLADFYQGCTISDESTPARTVERKCHRYVGIGNIPVRKDLQVNIERVPNCELGAWFSEQYVFRSAPDWMRARVQCEIRTNSTLKFAFYATGGRGACIGEQFIDVSTVPSTSHAQVTQLSPHWGGSCWSPFYVFARAGSGCVDGRCSFTFAFGTPVYSCPTGTLQGIAFLESIDSDGTSYAPLPAENCYTSQTPSFYPDTPLATCPSGFSLVLQSGAAVCVHFAASATVVDAAGWTVTLAFDQPSMVPVEVDSWNAVGNAITEGGRCEQVSPDRCVDGPSTKEISGKLVTRDCWAFESTYTCGATSNPDECSTLVAQGCTPQASTCQVTNPDTGACDVFWDTYSCAQPASDHQSASSCPTDVYCIGAMCFGSSSPPDPDFGRSVSMLEAGRQASKYIDTNSMTVFRGELNRCRDRLFTNCCYSDPTGEELNNKRVFGDSPFVYDALTLTSPFTVPLLDILVNCDANEAMIAKKEGAGLCHYVGEYCSTCTMVLGRCVACVEKKQSKCCFNSKLSRIINEQGRAQLAKGWGDAESPDCSGFTITQLEGLDFAAMDLSEFYSSIVPAAVDQAAVQGSASTRASTCYFGQGQCQ